MLRRAFFSQLQFVYLCVYGTVLPEKPLKKSVIYEAIFKKRLLVDPHENEYCYRFDLGNNISNTKLV